MKRTRSRSNTLKVNDYTVALASLRNLMGSYELIDKQISDPVQQKTVSQIFLKTKKQRLRDIFICKLKRVIGAKQSHEVSTQKKDKTTTKFYIEGIQYPLFFVNVVLILKIIAILVMAFISTVQGFIDKFHEEDSDTRVTTILKSIFLSVYVMYFAMKCTYKHYQQGINLFYIHQIIKDYMKDLFFFLDVIVIVSMFFRTIFPKQMALGGVFAFFMILQFFYTIPQLSRLQSYYFKSEKAVLTWGLIKICLFNIIVAHFMATFLLAMSRINLDQNWMTNAQITEEPWIIIYFYAFYWGTTIMMTVGFGDILPGNPSEIIITSFLQMFSCILLGYNISTIGNLISLIREKNQIIRKKRLIFERMIRNNDGQSSISPSLESEIFNHIKQQHNMKGNLDYIQRKELIQELPQNLRKAYNKQANQKIFQSVLFFNRLKPSTIAVIAEKFKSTNYHRGENISTFQNILILESGEVGLAYQKRGSSVNGIIFERICLKKGDPTQLLSTSFLSLNRQENYQLIVSQLSLVWSIDYNQFLESLEESSIDDQFYFTLLHKHCFNVDEWNTNKCMRCSSQKFPFYHNVFNCPKIVYLPLHSQIVGKIFYSSEETIERGSKLKRQKNNSAKSSALKLKKVFNKMIEVIKQQKREVNKVMSTFSKQKVEEADQIKNGQIIPNSNEIYNEKRLMQLIQATLRKYETGYQEDFWTLEIDQAYNFQFYFPLCNPNRIFQTQMVVEPLRNKIKIEKQNSIESNFDVALSI